MNTSELISVIIPVYNAEVYLEECAASVLQQSYANFELLLIDDGSTDRTPEICDRLGKTDGRIRVFHKENGGSASARNLGLQEAKGTYLAFVDADDRVSRNYLKVLYDLAVSHEADLVQCRYQSVAPSEDFSFSETEGTIEKRTNLQMLEEFCQKNTYLSAAVLWNKLYRKKLWEGLHFPEGKGIDDEFLVCQVLYRAERIVKTSAVLYGYFQSPGSQMRSKPTLKSLDNQYALEQQLAFFREKGQEKLCRMLLYRYLSCISGNYFFLRKHFPEEKERIQELRQKRRWILSAFKVKEIPFTDRCLLLIRGYCPGIFRFIHRLVKKS